MSDTNEMMYKEHEFALRGSDDGDIGHSDNEIEMDGLDGLEDKWATSCLRRVAPSCMMNTVVSCWLLADF